MCHSFFWCIMASKNVFQIAFDRIRKFAEMYGEVLIGFSGGRESIALLDICSKSGFARIHCFCMQFIPGMKCFEEPVIAAVSAYPSVQFEFVQHWNLFYHFKNEHYCFATDYGRSFPDVTFHDVCRMMVEKTGINLLFSGERLDDSLFRKMNLNMGTTVASPIATWKRWEVLAYLKQNRIGYQFGGKKFDRSKGSGLDLSISSVCWLHDNHHEDYQKMVEVFPFVDAIIKRREWYGITPEADYRMLNSRMEGQRDSELTGMVDSFNKMREEIREKYGEEEAKKFGK